MELAQSGSAAVLFTLRRDFRHVASPAPCWQGSLASEPLGH